MLPNMSICSELKTSLGELYYLKKDLASFIRYDKNKHAVAIKRKMEAIISEMSEPLGWRVNANERLEKFIIEYIEERGVVAAENSFGSTNNWMEVLKFCSIDFNAFKIIIKPKKGKLDLKDMSVVLPDNVVVEGNLVLGRHTKELPEDLIVKGKLMLVGDGMGLPEWLHEQVGKMNKNGQFENGFLLQG